MTAANGDGKVSDPPSDSPPDEAVPSRDLWAILALVGAMVAGVAFIGVVWWQFRSAAPEDADYIPYVYLSDPGPMLVSPNGKRSVAVVFNDAGAMHSGYHWTWLVIDRGLRGKRVVAQGYSVPEIRYGNAPLPVRWINDRSFVVEFAKGRYDPQPVSQAVRLD
jgi:hypothetical protein